MLATVHVSEGNYTHVDDPSTAFRVSQAARICLLEHFMPDAFPALIRIRYQCRDCQVNLETHMPNAQIQEGKLWFQTRKFGFCEY